MERRGELSQEESKQSSSQSKNNAPSEPFLKALGNLLHTYAEEHGLDFHEVVHSVGKSIQHVKKDKGNGNVLIPLAILADRDLGILESITKFLKEHYNLGYAEIARLLNRDSRTIWSTYSSAQGKREKPHDVGENGIWVAVGVFTDRRLGPLEALSLHLREEHGHSYAETARLLNRDSRTIWTACNRGREKLNGGAGR